MCEANNDERDKVDDELVVKAFFRRNVFEKLDKIRLNNFQYTIYFEDRSYITENTYEHEK